MKVENSLRVRRELITDMSERTCHEENVHLLMREVNHRSKNMLSVLDTIAHRIAVKNPEGFVERFSERIQALSANQDLLVRNDWRGVDVDDLIRAQLAHFADLIGSCRPVRPEAAVSGKFGASHRLGTV